jgi:hypothetical protein
MSTASIISKVWNFCNTRRDDGVGYGDYLEQLTYLLFLKMPDEYSLPPYKRPSGIPVEYNWDSLTSKRGAELELHYSAPAHRHLLQARCESQLLFFDNKPVAKAPWTKKVWYYDFRTKTELIDEARAVAQTVKLIVFPSPALS